MLRVACLCGRNLRVDESYIGKRVQCPACGTSQIVRDPADAEAGAGPIRTSPASDEAFHGKIRRKPVPTTPADDEPGGLTPWLLLAGGGVAALIVLAAAIGAYVYFNPRETKPQGPPETQTNKGSETRPDKTTAKDTAAKPGKTTYAIRLNAVRRPGEIRELKATTLQTTWSDRETGPIDETYRQDFEGLITTLEVNARGQETKVLVEIQKFTRNRGKEEELMPSGSQVICQIAEDKFIDVLDARTGLPLLTAGPLAVPPMINFLAGGLELWTDDLLFGTKEKQAIGSTWPIQREEFAKFINRPMGKTPRMIVPVGDISGRSTLVGVTTIDGQVYLDIQTTVDIKLDKCRFDDGELPPLELFATGTRTLSWTFQVPAHHLGGISKRVWQDKLNREVTGTSNGKEVRYKDRVSDVYTDEFKYRALGIEVEAGPARAPEAAPVDPGILKTHLP